MIEGMSNVIQHPNTSSYVIFTPERQKRHPSQTANTTADCPFCMGYESDTPPEVDRMGDGNPDTPGWQVRVVPNKYPITDIHEVIIHSPIHDQDIPDLPHEQVVKILTMYQKRLAFHEQNGRRILFNNAGKKAGMSLNHPHSQLAILPPEMSIPTQTIEPVELVVMETQYCVVYCPVFSQWPLEVWIKPTENESFQNMQQQKIDDLATVLQTILKRIIKLAHSDNLSWKDEEVPYNFMLLNPENWAIRITPRLQIPAGFELATNSAVNTLTPQKAYLLLQQAS